MKETNFLKELKIGDKVFVFSSWHGLSVGVVARLTKTQIILEDDSTRRFNNTSGAVVGGYTPYSASITLEDYNNQRYQELYIAEELNTSVKKLLKEIPSEVRITQEHHDILKEAYNKLRGTN